MLETDDIAPDVTEYGRSGGDVKVDVLHWQKESAKFGVQHTV